MNDLNSFLESAKKILQAPSLGFIAKDIWGSQNSSHRELLHAEVAKIKNINPQIYTSISHSDGIGILAYSKQPVGVDVELTSRVLEQIAARVSSREDVANAPSPASLWTAKEACFKALKTFDQPSVISRISIGDWEKIDSQTETCRLMNPQSFDSPSENRGVVIHTKHHTCSFFIFRT